MATASHVVLPGSQRTLLSGSQVLGMADAAQRIEVTVKLRRKAPLPEMTERPTTPLSRAESAAKYGATAEDIAKVKDVFGRYGLDVVRSDQATRSVVLSGPISAMETAFEVKLFRYAHVEGNYRGRSGMLQIPAELNGIVIGVFGLDNRRVISRRKRRPDVAVPTAALSLATATHRGFFPQDLAKLYGFPDGDGSGQTIGIVEFGGQILKDDLELFCKRIGVEVPAVVEIDVDGEPADTSDDSSVEVMLDIEVVAGICPKASIPVYFGQTFDEQSWVNTIDRAIHDSVHNPSVLSISWGNSEDGFHSAWQGMSIDNVSDSFQEAALMGVTICVASGDDGSDDQGGDGKAHADFPGSSPFVLAVGGTDLRVRQGTVTERVWKDGTGIRPGGGSSGGGVSTHFPRPAFQKAITIKNVNPGSILGRVVPDVSAHAQSDNRTTGYFIVVDGNGILVGGTSAAAPLWASLILRINALRAAKGKKPIGYVTPLLYQAGANGQPLGASVCKDITVGDNISAHNGGYRAGPGFDAATGWGSPIGAKLAAALVQVP